MRLSEFEINAMRSVFRQCFEGKGELWLFGSRVDDKKRGGDIDLCIKFHKKDIDTAFEGKIKFLGELKARIGDQKIDVVLRFPDSQGLIFDRIDQEGMKIC